MSRNTVWNMRPSLAAGLLLAALALPAAGAPALPRLPFESTRVGQGSLNLFGFHLYDATLWAPGGRWRADAPYALEFVYARSFAGGTLASSTIGEIRRQRRLDPASLPAWEGRLKALLPDVRPGDRLAAVRLPGKGVAFHAGPRALGQIEDEAFAESFFAIWLDPATRRPDLRARLLGG